LPFAWQCDLGLLFSFFFFHSGLPNYRSSQAPTQEVCSAVPIAGDVQVSGDQNAVGANIGGRHDHQEDAGAWRHGTAHCIDHVTVLPEPQLRGLRVRCR